MTNAINNADEHEIAKFSALANEWWNPFGSCKPLHEINPLRLAFIQQYCSLEGRRILDVGCGGGILTESLAMAGGQVMAIDLSLPTLNAAKLHAKEQNLEIDYQLAAVEDLVQDYAGEFDIITCMELLEHVPQPDSIINACSSLLKPSGHLFLSTINRQLKSYLYAILAAEYWLKLLPKGTHDYEKFIKPEELFEMLLASSLHLTHMAGMTYHPVTKTYVLTPNVAVNYLIHATPCP